MHTGTDGRRFYPLILSRSCLTTTQEYLSKPLKQNQLIQTILKCATLGGALQNDQRITSVGGDNLEERDVFHTPQSTPTPKKGASSQVTPSKGTPSRTPRRPHLEIRGFTESAQAGMESPSLLAADQSDPVERVSDVLTDLSLDTDTNTIQQLLLRSHSS